MSKLTRTVIALCACLAVASTAMAAPSGNGKGNAYAYGLYKNRGALVAQPVAEPVVSPLSTVEAPKVETATWEWVTMYTDPEGTAPYVVPLYTQAKTGYLGYAEGMATARAEDYRVGGEVVYRTYQPVFSISPESPVSAATWCDPLHRVTYAYPGYTTVTFGGVAYPIDSAEAREALNTPGVRWQATYREMWDSAGYCTPCSFNAWAVTDFSPVD